MHPTYVSSPFISEVRSIFLYYFLCNSLCLDHISLSSDAVTSFCASFLPVAAARPFEISLEWRRVSVHDASQDQVQLILHHIMDMRGFRTLSICYMGRPSFADDILGQGYMLLLKDGQNGSFRVDTITIPENFDEKPLLQGLFVVADRHHGRPTREMHEDPCHYINREELRGIDDWKDNVFMAA
jgi:hypothetical protein